MRPFRLCLGVAAITAAASLTWGQAQEPASERRAGPRLDAHGDPLPAAALARLGTLRFRHRDQNFAGLTADGKGLLLYGRDGLHVMDADSGKFTQWSRANHLEPNRFYSRMATAWYSS